MLVFHLVRKVIQGIGFGKWDTLWFVTLSLCHFVTLSLCHTSNDTSICVTYFGCCADTRSHSGNNLYQTIPTANIGKPIQKVCPFGPLYLRHFMSLFSGVIEHHLTDHSGKYLFIHSLALPTKNDPLTPTPENLDILNPENRISKNTVNQF